MDSPCLNVINILCGLRDTSVLNVLDEDPVSSDLSLKLSIQCAMTFNLTIDFNYLIKCTHIYQCM